MSRFVLMRENIAGETLASAMLFTEEEVEHRVRAAQTEEDAVYDGDEKLRWHYFAAEVVRK